MRTTDLKIGDHVRFTANALKRGFASQSHKTVGVVVGPKANCQAKREGMIYVQRDGLKRPERWAAEYWEPDS